MLFLIDANLPPVLASAFVQAGHEALHVEGVGLRHANDDIIWEFSLERQAVVITKDEDFPDRCLRSTPTPIVLWLRIGNCRNPELLAWITPLLPEITARIESGDRLIEVG